MSVSVCMATYNGIRYVREQMKSIIDQLGPDDELVIVDDGSSDGTVDALRGFRDARLRVFESSSNGGHVAAFARAMTLARGEIIVLADQDDRWIPSRLGMLVESLQTSGCWLTTSNSSYMDAGGRPIEHLRNRVRSEDSARHMKNIADILCGRSMYFGCTMALRRDLLRIVLPIPRYVQSHDIWIAIAANLLGSNVHLDSVTLVRRIHGGNATNSRRKFAQKVWSRVFFLMSIAVLFARTRSLRGSLAVGRT